MRYFHMLPLPEGITRRFFISFRNSNTVGKSTHQGRVGKMQQPLWSMSYYRIMLYTIMISFFLVSKSLPAAASASWVHLSICKHTHTHTHIGSHIRHARANHATRLHACVCIAQNETMTTHRYVLQYGG